MSETLIPILTLLMLCPTPPPALSHFRYRTHRVGGARLLEDLFSRSSNRARESHAHSPVTCPHPAPRKPPQPVWPQPCPCPWGSGGEGLLSVCPTWCRIFCQRLETVTFISQKALGDNLGCNGSNSGSFITEIHWKGWRGENTGSVMSPSLSSLGLPPQAGGASGRTECRGKPAINQLCLY